MPNVEIRGFKQLDYQTREAINALCTNLSIESRDAKKILITSCQPEEGKSFIAMNLMRTFARLGLNVVLVDADIRASRLQIVYDIHLAGGKVGAIQGLTNYLSGHASIENVLHKTDIKNASVVLSGKNVMNSLAYLRSSRLDQILDALKERFDIVLVDAPPLGAIIDAVRVAECCDGAVLVVESGRNRIREVQSAVEQIEKTGCSLIGMILNKVEEDDYEEGYYYSSPYGKYVGNE